MRKELIEELIKEVYGPRNGSEEVIEGNPFTEYITGVIVPRTWKKDEPDPDSEITGPGGEYSLSDDDSSDDEYLSFPVVELDPRMKISTFGISFMVEGKNPSMEICITWGTYEPEKKDPEKNTWKRTPHYYNKELLLDKDTEKGKRIQIDNDGGRGIYLYIKRTPSDSYYTIRIQLVNDIDISKCDNLEDKARNTLFQPSIRIILKDDTRIVNPSMDKIADAQLSFLYRQRPVLAMGHMCSAIWKDIDYHDKIDREIIWTDGIYFRDKCEKFFECDVRTEFIPLYPDPYPLFDWNKDYGKNPELSAHILSEMWERDKIDEYLKPLIDGYNDKWIDNNKHEIEKLDGVQKKIPYELVDKQIELLDRMMKGINILKDDEDARLSFCFANRAIMLQHGWKKKGEYFKWRPYQMAFILSALEPLCKPDSPYRDFIDLLWVPTGGGKTETYLALMAFVMAYRRRREIKDKKNGGGTAVITRYTLRLLAIQQFRRTLAMVTAAEYLRVMKVRDNVRGWRPEKCSINDDLVYGSIRFSIGMWVGGSVSPNHLRKEKNAIDVLEGKDGEGEPAQVIRCPVCGTYLSVPDSGIPAGEKLYITVKSAEGDGEIKNKISKDDYVKDVDVKSTGNIKTINIVFKENMDESKLSNFWKRNGINGELLTFRISRPGYFKCQPEKGKRKKQARDFEIYCPNLDCELNKNVEYIEGVQEDPFNDLAKNENDLLPDKLHLRKPEFLFDRMRIPIPAYTVDEQVYHRCPTVIVGTADKIARLAFEPRAASIFGLVEKYNAFYGYYHKDLLPEAIIPSAEKGHNVNVDPFHPPELIIQDELHLIEGPLGSLFGLYETAVEGLIKTVKPEFKPKYIASTATIKNASDQVKRLFGKELFQFPPHGLYIDDNFFIRSRSGEDVWNENTSGRIYMGIYSPGMGPLTPLIRIWARLLRTVRNKMNDKDIQFYWSLVGYFNALRELGGGMAIYREDIYERVRQIDSGTGTPLNLANVIELSSRINSTDLPILLDRLERWNGNKISENPDAIFTTSIFGTGVDISHLSLMVVNGQPKTTSQYIQATGRIGRSHGGLVVVFLRAGRPRDLSHYEFFTAYHRRILLNVEPSSVSPFSEGCLEKASGPVMVSFLRNMDAPIANWYKDDGKIIVSNGDAEQDIERFMKILTDRVKKIYGKSAPIEDIENYFKSQVDRWRSIALAIGQDDLAYVEYPYREPQKNVVLGDPYHEKSDRRVVFRNSPQSLREIEETVGFWV